MTRSRMTLIVVLMCAAIAGVVILQGSWLINSYAVSKEQNEAEVKSLLDLALVEQKKLTADTVRRLMRQFIRSKNDFHYRIVDFPDGLKIGFAGLEQRTFALHSASAEDTILLKKDPFNFLIKKMATLKLDELDPLYTTLIGMKQYSEDSPERAIQLKLGKSFTPYENTLGLTAVINKVFAKEGRSFNGYVLYFKDAGGIYNKTQKAKSRKKQLLSPAESSIAVFPGSEHARSLATKLESIEAYTDSLNRVGDSTFVAKPILFNATNILSETIPAIFLAVHTPRTLIGKKMAAGILGSFALMAFITLSVIYMYNTIVKQKQLSDLKNDFISNISHELKTPIATAQAAVQGLKFFDNNQNPEKASSYLSTASSEIQRLSLMVDKILNISLFESFTFTLSSEYFNFNTLLTEIVESQRLRREKPIEVSLDYDAKPVIFADKTQLQTVILNLIDNAIKYSGAQVMINIKARNYSGGIEVSIWDNGNGIPAEYRDYIFDKFFRVPDPNSHTVKGYGLGLNYVKVIIEKHQGSILLRSSGDHGSEFLIKLPQKG